MGDLAILIRPRTRALRLEIAAKQFPQACSRLHPELKKYDGTRLQLSKQIVVLREEFQGHCARGWNDATERCKGIDDRDFPRGIVDAENAAQFRFKVIQCL